MGSPTRSRLASSAGSGHVLFEPDLFSMLEIITDGLQGEVGKARGKVDV
jgi:hypothetical protein